MVYASHRGSGATSEMTVYAEPESVLGMLCWCFLAPAWLVSRTASQVTIELRADSLNSTVRRVRKEKVRGKFGLWLIAAHHEHGT